MKKEESKRVSPYIALKGEVLSCHFHFLDRMLWRSLYIISQTEPVYLQRYALEPVIRQLSGRSHGRRWFILGKNVAHNGHLVDAIRYWVQTDDWETFLKNLSWLNLYRDTLRQWVEEYESHNPQIQQNLKEWLQAYYKIRDEIVEAYLPLVWSIASSYGFTEDARADMFQIGTTGLVHATERYNNVGPVSFPSFASRWIRQRILMAISRQFPMIRVSHSVLEKNAQISREERQSGKKDDSDKATKIKMMASTKDVVLMEDISDNSLTTSDDQKDERLDLDVIPQDLRKVLLLTHDIIDRAKHRHSSEDLKKERLRQIEKYLSLQQSV